MKGAPRALERLRWIWLCGSSDTASTYDGGRRRPWWRVPHARDIRACTGSSRPRLLRASRVIRCVRGCRLSIGRICYRRLQDMCQRRFDTARKAWWERGVDVGCSWIEIGGHRVRKATDGADPGGGCLRLWLSGRHVRALSSSMRVGACATRCWRKGCCTSLERGPVQRFGDQRDFGR